LPPPGPHLRRDHQPRCRHGRRQRHQCSATNVEYIPYHICSSKTVLHKIYHDPAHPSHLLLLVIPNA
jgi:hypothetical protein